VAINNNNDFHSVQSVGHHVAPGQRLVMSVKSSELSSSDSFKQFSVDNRKCKYRHEISPESMFRVKLSIEC